MTWSVRGCWHQTTTRDSKRRIRSKSGPAPAPMLKQPLQQQQQQRMQGCEAVPRCPQRQQACSCSRWRGSALRASCQLPAHGAGSAQPCTLVTCTCRDDLFTVLSNSYTACMFTQPSNPHNSHHQIKTVTTCLLLAACTVCRTRAVCSTPPHDPQVCARARALSGRGCTLRAAARAVPGQRLQQSTGEQASSSRSRSKTVASQSEGSGERGSSIQRIGEGLEALKAARCTGKRQFAGYAQPGAHRSLGGKPGQVREQC